MMTKMYHYTCVGHLPSIFRNGFLKLTEPNLRRDTRPNDPWVVWLTLSPNRSLEMHKWASFNQQHVWYAHKTVVRFTVELPMVAKPDYHQGGTYDWFDWKRCRNPDKHWIEILKTTGGDWRNWVVSEAPVYSSSWLRVDMEVEGVTTVLWENGQLTDHGRRVVAEMEDIVPRIKFSTFSSKGWKTSQQPKP